MTAWRRIFAFEGGGAIRQYEGGYTDYQAPAGTHSGRDGGIWDGIRSERGRGQKTGGAFGAGTSDAAETAKDKTAAASARKAQIQLYGAERVGDDRDDIAALEEAIADLEQQMQDSARDYTALNGIIKKKRKKKLFGRKDGPLDGLNDLAEK